MVKIFYDFLSEAITRIGIQLLEVAKDINTAQKKEPFPIILNLEIILLYRLLKSIH